MPQIWKIVANTVTSGSYDVVIPPQRTLWAWGDNLYGQLGDGNAAYKVNSVGSLNTWVSASNGAFNSAAIKSDGTLWIWGLNAYRVVDTSAITRSSPVQVGTDTDWLNIEFGDYHALALKNNGYMYGWGDNSRGQTGYPLPTTPTLVDNVSDWKILPKTAIRHMVGIKTDNTLWSWGTNSNGELGDGTRINRSSPVQIGSDSWKAVTVSEYHSSFIKADGSLWATGYNFYGVMGGGNYFGQYSSPIQIGLLTDWSDISSNLYSSLALKTDGTLWSWGFGGDGVLGNNLAQTITSPIQIGAETNWSRISMGYSHAAAIKTDGTLWTWGYAGLGSLGGGDTINRSSPVQVGIDTDWSKIACGQYVTLAIKTDGTLWSWGYNNSGEIGDGTRINRSSPVQIGTETNWTNIFTGRGNHSIGIKTDNTAWAWGLNNRYQLGDSTNINRSSPVQIGTLSNWLTATGGNTFSFLVNNSYDLYSWGINSNGQLGNNTVIGTDTTSISTPTQLNNDSWKKIVAKKSYSLAIKNDDTLWVTGYNINAVLGTNNVNNIVLGFTQLGSSYYLDVSTGGLHSLAIKTDGTLWGWGYNDAGAVGDGTRINRSSPVQIGTDTNWSKVFAGGSHSMAIKTDGTLWSWGSNSSAELGDNTQNPRSSPVQIGTLTNWLFVSLGDRYTTAIKTDNTLWAWGLGVLTGTGVFGNISSPVQVGSLTWNDVSAAISHTIAVDSSGNLYSWGSNNFYGVLGNSFGSISPIQIGSDTNWIDVEIAPRMSMNRKTTNAIFAVGDNSIGQLGINSTSPADNFTQIGTDTDWSKLKIAKAANSAFNRVGAIKNDGTLWGWGYGSTGGIGDGTTQSRSSPVQIGTETNWKDLATGTSHTIAVKTDGTLWSWGNNSLGQLGHGNTINRSSPVQIGTGTDWDNVGVGHQHSLAIKTDGTLWAWGWNNNGMIGDDTFSNRSSPVQIGTETNWTYVEGSEQQSYALKSDGSIYAWGSNSQAQLGLTPVSYIVIDGQWKDVSAGGGFTLGIKSNGTLWSWGNNAYGQLGTGTPGVSRSSPVQVGTDSNWKTVTTSNQTFHSLAIKTDGTLWGWGRNNQGEIGDGTLVQKSSPIQVGLLTDWENVSTFSSHTIAIKTDGTIWSWGNNSLGQLGDGTTVSKSSPVQIGIGTDWSYISAGSNYAMAVKTDGTLWGWGYNNLYQLGIGITANRSSPVQVGTDTNWSKVIAGSQSTLGIKTDGSIWCWGYDNQGQTGYPIPKTPIKIDENNNWKEIDSGRNHSIAIKIDGTLWSWGINDTGGLGLNDITKRSSPVQIGTDTNWSKISAGNSYTMAVKTDGTLWGWGLNNYGQIGDNTTTNKSSPIQIGTDTNWEYIGTNSNITYAIKSDGTLWAWGFNSNGAIGDGTKINRSSPVQIGTDTNWTLVKSFGGQQEVGVHAIKTDGTLWGWGYNGVGNLGDLTTISRSSPVQIGSGSTWKSIAVGGYYSVTAIKTDGTLWGWGDNQYSEIGIIGNGRSSPVQIGSDSDWDFVEFGYYHSFAAKTNGDVYGFGTNTPYGELASGFLNAGGLSQGPNPYLKNMKKISPGAYFTIFIDQNSGSYSAGVNNDGQLGLNNVIGGERAYFEIPYMAKSGSYFVAPKNQAGSLVVCDTDGNLFVSGINGNGALGTFSNSNVLTGLTKNIYISGIVSSSSGNSYSAVIDNSGSLFLSGQNDSGQLGRNYPGSNPSSTQTVKVPVKGDGNKYTKISAGYQYAMGIKTDGTLWGWGTNTLGRIGDNTILARSYPVQISSLSGWIDVSAGLQETNAIYEVTGSS